MRFATGIVLTALMGATTCSALAAQQDTKSQVPRGTVTGTISCTDTNAPARMARIMLLPAHRQPNGRVFMTDSDLDGRFALGKLPEGTYYVSVKYKGYLDPFPRAEARDLAGMSEEQRRRLDAHAISVTVGGQQTSTVAVRLDRAAVIEGTVLYDDGSPGIGLRIIVRAKRTSTEGKPADAMYAMMMDLSDSFEHATDDHGHFRILGVAPGEYLVSTLVSTASGAAPPSNPGLEAVKSFPAAGLVMYYGDTPRASAAKPIKIQSGETASGTDITIPLSKLHTVRGQVVLKSSGHSPLSASLRLLYADTRETARVMEAPNGEFEFGYLPEGSYILQASAEAKTATSPVQVGASIVVSGGSGLFLPVDGANPPSNFNGGNAGEIPIDVHGEVSGITLSVPDPVATKATASSNASAPAAQ